MDSRNSVNTKRDKCTNTKPYLCVHIIDKRLESKIKVRELNNRGRKDLCLILLENNKNKILLLKGNYESQ